MANSCRNKLKVSGSEESLNNFKIAAMQYDVEFDNGVYDYVFSLDALYPCPFDAEPPTDETSDLAYDWRGKNWGTPVIYSDCKELDVTDNTFSVVFYSSWAPALLAFKKISRDYPDLLFEIIYWGLQCGYCGKCVFNNGEVIDHEHFEYDEYEAFFVHDDCSADEVTSDGNPELWDNVPDSEDAMFSCQYERI